jgi:hypothetical protein
LNIATLATIMRDDLHRTEALRNHWRRAVRLAGRPAERGAAALELARATFQEFREGIRNEWSSELNAKIRLSGNELFGIDGTLGIIDALERKAVRPLEFRLCEILRCSAYDQRPDEIVRAAQVAVRQECAESAIEHCALSVAREHDEGQARELRQAMSAMLARADLSEEPHLKRKSAGDPGELVDTPLELTL